MGYVTGTCTSFTDIKSTIVSIAQLAGWSSTTDSSGNTVIYKGNLYVMIDMGRNIYSTPYYDCVRIKGRTGINEGTSPIAVGISNWYGYRDSYPSIIYTTGPVLFPVRYFGFYYSDIDEIYFVITYNYIYQYIAFGKSNIDLPGTGLWIAGTCACEGDNPYPYGNTASSWYRPMNIWMSPGSTETHQDRGIISPAMFWLSKRTYHSSTTTYADRNYWLHSNLGDGGDPWSLATSQTYSDAIGASYVERYLKSQPQQANNQAMLLPIMAYKTSYAYSNTYYHVATLQKARHIKINYLDPETIVTNGDEQWVVFPWFKKVQMPPHAHAVEDREGSISYIYYAVNHSGNYGWAVKKEA